ncbi:hypothetical protein KOR42_40980 [Thalassoglobus neptunius]|uniref:Planctomycete cytochrome C n=1 Tax=Thalassoglobus neptunius TaxID=1938619 RepID=A0A5C5WB48_9PLAN|nr:DUF1588 domain-containing protein [Thalassoglobus neptunius]TWT47900.1 hypothetical protein KOR42_40980 [Thalassoglobus neptunius]
MDDMKNWSQQQRSLLTFFWSFFVLGISVTSAAEDIPQPVQVVLQTYCTDCHSEDYAEGNLRLDGNNVDWSVPDSLVEWEKVLTMVSKRIMPPPEGTALTPQDRELLLSWLDQKLSQNSPVGGTPLRRLNRREYRNSIASLFDLEDFELPNSFPRDNIQHGFDNQGDALVISPSHFEAFAETAAVVAYAFFAPPRPIVPSRQYEVAAGDLTISYSSACYIDGAMRLASSGKNTRRHATWPSRFVAPQRGTYRVQVTASSTEGCEKTPILRIEAMRDFRDTLKEFHEFELGHSERSTVEFDIQLDRGESLFFRYPNGPLNYDDKNIYQKFLADLFQEDRQLAAAWAEVGTPARGGSGWQRVREVLESAEMSGEPLTIEDAEVEKVIQKMARNAVGSGETLVYRFFEQGPYVAIHHVSITGALNPQTDREDEQRERRRMKLMGEFDGQTDRQSLEAFFTSFLRKAFRRPVSPAEAQEFVEITLNEHARSGSLRNGLHLAVRMALISPSFLYRSIGTGELDDYELASRLSYFLTAGPPDEQLMKKAETHVLRQREVLLSEAERLIDRRFASDFPKQWLGLSAIESLMPDNRLIRNFTKQHRGAMMEEVTETFWWVLDNNLPVKDLIAPDFVFTSELVAKEIYQLDEFADVASKKSKKNESTLTRVTVPRLSNKGGLLCMPAVMMATANGVDTQPVLRGVWVLENILGSPPPDPPNAVPALTPDTRGANSPKERLAAHMQEASCASCHREIDPLGFVLENFDPVGRWRTSYPVYTETGGKVRTTNGLEVDASGTLPDGSPLSNVSDLKEWLIENPKPFTQCLSEKLLTYATGRSLSYRERTLVGEIIDQQEGEDVRLKTLLLELIDSPIFRTK